MTHTTLTLVSRQRTPHDMLVQAQKRGKVMALPNSQFGPRRG